MHWQELQPSVGDASLAATEVDEDTIPWERREEQACPASQPSSTADIEMWHCVEGRPASAIAWRSPVESLSRRAESEEDTAKACEDLYLNCQEVLVSILRGKSLSFCPSWSCSLSCCFSLLLTHVFPARLGAAASLRSSVDQQRVPQVHQGWPASFTQAHCPVLKLSSQYMTWVSP